MPKGGVIFYDEAFLPGREDEGETRWNALQPYDITVMIVRREVGEEKEE